MQSNLLSAFIRDINMALQKKIEFFNTTGLQPLPEVKVGDKFLTGRYRDCQGEPQVFVVVQVTEQTVVYCALCFKDYACGDHLPPGFSMTVAEYLETREAVDRDDGTLVDLKLWCGVDGSDKVELALDVLFKEKEDA